MTTDDMPDIRPSVDTRAREYGVTIAVGPGRRVNRSNHRPDDGWEGWEHDSYRVKLSCQGRTMTTTYRMGTGHNGSPPSLAMVLDSLVSDAAGTDEPFEEWCRSYGYDDDSRAAERTYRACVKVRADLARLLGDPARLEALMYDTQRL